MTLDNYAKATDNLTVSHYNMQKISIFMSRYGLIALNKERLVLALGGNAIVGGSRTFQSQLEAVSSVTGDIAKLVRKGYSVLITHGNGPQVGNSLLRHESARHLVPPPSAVRLCRRDARSPWIYDPVFSFTPPWRQR